MLGRVAMSDGNQPGASDHLCPAFGSLRQDTKEAVDMNSNQGPYSSA